MQNVVVVGVGALGSHLVQFLRNEDVSIKVIDFDRVESKNVASQFHGKSFVGKSKVQSVQQTISMFFGKRVEVVPHKLTADNVVQLLGGADLVIDCLDNGASREVVQIYVRANKIACLHGAVSADGSFGRVIWDEDFVIDFEAKPGQPTCENGEHLPFLVSVSAYLARSAQDFLRRGRKIGYSIHPGGVIAT